MEVVMYVKKQIVYRCDFLYSDDTASIAAA